ncbi:hypothetical protein [Candidatus Korarchaeum cryptofilum]|jgi:hypothetical protein|uniref:hypothetical protein n=1 Tax=Candidatus Korarchaeum cryptofilum TaxID=498846 RepID=UPI000698C381|nr:hypothetical protein [Candidatus Korarchaeum cryptofilum]
MEGVDSGNNDALRGKMRVLERIEMVKEKYKCQYVPLIKLTKLLSSMGNEDAVEVLIDTDRFSLESVEALARAYGASCEIVSSKGNLLELLIRRCRDDR